MHTAELPRVTALPCVTAAEIFQHPLVEEPVVARTESAEARRLVATATRACHSCPMVDKCLYDAVVRHDVAGIAAGTTVTQRQRMRRMLGIRVEPEALGDFTGTTREGSRLSHSEVARIRRADPGATLESIAERLGCSLSTVKRHLRQARAAGPVAPVASARPTLRDVLAAKATVVVDLMPAKVA